jgi:hypothetical protein
MRKNLFLTIALCSALVSQLLAQNEDSTKRKDLYVPYVTVSLEACFSNPFSFTAGVQQVKESHFNVAIDVHYWSTNYECSCDDLYSKGHFSSITPSVRLVFNTGGKMEQGFVASLGLGYMFAKDRGIEQPYVRDNTTGNNILTGKAVYGKWDFNSLAPSISAGLNVKLLHLPFTFGYILYMAKSTKGWEPEAGGIGVKIGLHRF